MGEIATARSPVFVEKGEGRVRLPGWRVTRPYTYSLFVLVLLALLAVVMTWPLALNANHALIGTDSNALNDSYLNVWIFGWQAHQLLVDPLHLFQGNIFYPFHNTLAFSEIILPEALLYLPLHLASGNPILAYNLVLLALFPLNGFAMYLWALDTLSSRLLSDPKRPMTGESAKRLVTASELTPRNEREGERQSRSGARRGQGQGLEHASAFLAGLIFAFCAYKLGEIRHVQLLAAQFMPLTLLYVARGLRTPNRHNAILTALFFVLNALSSLYYALFLGLALALYVGVDFLVRRYHFTRGYLSYALTAATIAGVCLIPVTIPYVQMEREMHFSAGRDPRLFAARPASYLASPGTNWLYGSASRNFYIASKGQPLFPGIGVLGLAMLGVFTWRQRDVILFILLGLGGFVLSFGPVLLLNRDLQPVTSWPLPFHWLSLIITPLNNLNAPARLAVLLMLALAMLAAFGFYWLAMRVRRGRIVLLASLVTFILLEDVAVPLPLASVAAGGAVSPAYTFLAAQPPNQPVVEVPMGAPTFADQDKHVEYTYNSVYHWQPLVNGYSTFIPPAYYDLVKDMQKFPSAATVQRLKQWGVVFVVLHSDRLNNAGKIRATLQGLAGIEHLQDFDRTWLYRIE